MAGAAAAGPADLASESAFQYYMATCHRPTVVWHSLKVRFEAAVVCTTTGPTVLFCVCAQWWCKLARPAAARRRAVYTCCPLMRF